MDQRASIRKPQPAPQDVVKLQTKWAGQVPHLKQGTYADGLPLHEVEYLACKLILKPNSFTSRQSLFKFGKVLRAPADQCDVNFSTMNFENAPLKIREVLFVDTADFRLYNNAFILRRRIPYTDGFPSGEPEIVFKFRHPDIQLAAETDVRPHILGDHRVKFKCQALPLKDRLGGIRILFATMCSSRALRSADRRRNQIHDAHEGLPGAGTPEAVAAREGRAGQRHHY